MVVREDSAVAESQRQPTLARPDTLRPTRKRLFNNERQVGDRETRLHTAPQTHHNGPLSFLSAVTRSGPWLNN